ILVGQDDLYSIDVNHNLIYGNTGQGVLVSQSHGIGVSIASNTIYTASGDGVRVKDGSTSVSLRNNIIWTANGYDINVAVDSQQGFTSDYNNLFASGSGKIVWFEKEFTDLFDWQAEADYDDNSIGYTALAPTLDQPFTVANANAGDFTLHAGSTSI